MLRTCNFVLLGKIVNLPYTAKLSKRKILPYNAEIFNKVEQNQLPRTKNVGKFLDATETLSISAGSIINRAEMSCGTQPTGE